MIAHFSRKPKAFLDISLSIVKPPEADTRVGSDMNKRCDVFTRTYLGREIQRLDNKLFRRLVLAGGVREGGEIPQQRDSLIAMTPTLCPVKSLSIPHLGVSVAPQPDRDVSKILLRLENIVEVRNLTSHV
jgi:hypothetical protein